MAIDIEEIRWASSDVNDPVTGAANKQEPTGGVKSSGLVRNEALLRDNLNYQFDKYADFFQDLQNQIDALTLSASTGVLTTIYHVGSHYLSDVSQSPATRFGFGTWQRIQGRFLVGLQEGDTDFSGIAVNNGNKNHSHTHTLNTADAGAHTHSIPVTGYGADQTSSSLSSPTTQGRVIVGSGRSETGERFESLAHAANPSSTNQEPAHSHTINGGINTSSNLPPYRPVYWWVRTA